MNWLGELVRQEIGEGDSVLDLGCGTLQATGVLGARHLAVDCFRPYLDEIKDRTLTLHAFIPLALEMFPARSWDVVLLLDVLEHLRKDAALSALTLAEHVARKKVILFTPLGMVAQVGFNYAGFGFNPWQEHRCGFIVSELEQRGYSCLLHDNHSLQAGEHKGIYGVRPCTSA